MKERILAYLRDFPLQPTQNICAGTGLKRSSVSKCLTRMIRNKLLTCRALGGKNDLHLYSIAGYEIPEVPSQDGPAVVTSTETTKQ